MNEPHVCSSMRDREARSWVAVLGDAARSDRVAELDRIAARLQGHSDAWLSVTRLIILQRVGEDNELSRATALAHDWLSVAEREARPLLAAGGHALMSLTLGRAGRESDALNEAMIAAILLDDPVGITDWSRQDPLRLAQACTDLAAALTQLGLYEPANENLGRAIELHTAIRSAHDRNRSTADHEYGYALLLRIYTTLLWGLREETGGQVDFAATRYQLANRTGSAVRLLTRTRGQRLATHRALAVATRTAQALAAPHTVDVSGLVGVATSDLLFDENFAMITRIATARAFRAAGEPGRADDLLAATQAARPNLLPDVRLCLLRESVINDGSLCEPGPMRDYLEALERQVGSASRERLATFVAHSVSERLRGGGQEIRQLALLDPLTGLPNRRELDSWPERISRAGRSTVALIDIDGLKPINDTYSHQAGDRVLKTVARTLHVHAPEASLARYGGDEFVALLAGVPPAQASRAFTQAVRAIATLPDDILYGATISVGLSTTDDHHPLDDALSAADRAMYEAKNAGGSQIRCYAERP